MPLGKRHAGSLPDTDWRVETVLLAHHDDAKRLVAQGHVVVVPNVRERPLEEAIAWPDGALTFAFTGTAEPLRREDLRLHIGAKAVDALLGPRWVNADRGDCGGMGHESIRS